MSKHERKMYEMRMKEIGMQVEDSDQESEMRLQRQNKKLEMWRHALEMRGHDLEMLKQEGEFWEQEIGMSIGMSKQEIGMSKQESEIECEMLDQWNKELEIRRLDSEMSKLEMESEQMRFRFNKRLMDLILKIRSIPDDAKVKEAFLFELILNATAAVCKVRFESMVNETIHGPDPELFIHVVPDMKIGSLTIIDSGVGMNDKELNDYLCNIPKHAQKKYMKTIKRYDSTTKDVYDISSLYSYPDRDAFSLGFHSVYMVADKVGITTKKSGGDQYVWHWQSNSWDYYTFDEDTSGETLGRGGTKITLFLNENTSNTLKREFWMI